MIKKLIILFVIWAIIGLFMIVSAFSDDSGVTVTTTITDDGEDLEVAEYSLPINNQHSDVVKLETEITEVKKEVIEVKKEEPILPTGYSILVTDEMVVYPIHGNISIWARVESERIEAQQKNFHVSEFDKIHIQHEQNFKHWR